MRGKWSLHFIIGFGGLLFFFAALSAAADGPAYVPGRLLAGPKRDADAGVVSRALVLHGAVVRKRLSGAGMSVLEVPEESSQAILESLRNSGLFEYVERDYYAHTAAVPNDPLYSSEWHLAQIQAPQAWDISAGSSSIVVAVIDSGVDATHPDLASKLVPGWNFLTGSADTSDDLGHGTAVAGTIAAASNNGIGVAGVSWGSAIMPLVVVDATDFASYSNIAAAIEYAADHGARVINISIGGSSASAALQSAVDYAWGKGAILFASPMNAGSTAPYYPAACNHVAAVSATDSSDLLASFSNYGNWIALAAPGANILAPMQGGSYGYWYGTSFSAPIAAGVAALALSVNPTLANTDLLSLLEQNADDLGAAGYDTSFGWGRVNAYKAVVAAQRTAISVSVTPATATLSAGQTQQFTATVANSTAGVTWNLSPAVGTISAAGLYTAPSSITSAQTVTVTATSVADPTKSAAATITLQAPAPPPPPPPPVSVSITPTSVTLTVQQVQQFTATVINSTAGVTWTLSPVVGTLSSTGVYTAPASIASAETVTVTATSVSDPTKFASAFVTLQPPPPPPSVAITPASVSLTAKQTQQFTAAVTNSTARVTWTISPAVGTISSTGLYTAPSSIVSSKTVTVTAAVPGASAQAVITLIASRTKKSATLPERRQ